jgi:uncharacterized phage protein (TIGR02218 family)
LKTLSSAFLSHVRGEDTTLAFCWKLTLRDGRVIGFTAHDQPLLIDGVSYEPGNSISPTAYQQDLSLSSDDVQLEALFDSDQISEADLVGGRLDGATYFHFLVNWAAPPTSLSGNDYLSLTSGQLGGYSANERTFTAEGLSLIDRLSEKQPVQTSPVCRASLGDGQCKINLAPYTYIANVTAIADNQVLTLQGSYLANYFQNGECQFLSGANAPARVKILTNSISTITLFLPTFYDIAVGDQIKLIAGCNKTVATCRDRFSNILNFRGEPSIPGQDVFVSGVPVESLDDEDG